MNLDDLKRQAEAQGGRIIRARTAPWSASNGVVMTEHRVSVAVPTAGGFAALRQWARKQGAMEHSVYDVAAEAFDWVMDVNPGRDRDEVSAIANKVVDETKYKDRAVMLGWLED